MHSSARITSLTLVLACAFLLACAPFYAHATTTIYNFNSDTIGQTPLNTTVATGTAVVSNQATLGNALHVTAVPPVTGGVAVLSFDNFASTTNYSVTWKSAYDSPGGNRHGFMLRTQPTEAPLIESGFNQGYLFQVNNSNSGKNPNTVKLYAVTAGATTQIMTASLTSAQPRWFKALVVGNQLGFYYSNDGTTYTLLTGTTTDSTFSSGGVQYVAGFGQGVGLDYVDDVTQTTLPTIISSVASTTGGTSATITWTTDELSDSQIEYGATVSYTASTTLDAALATSHSQTITGLSPSTTYHFRVRGTNAYGDLGLSSDYTFTTGATSIAITSPKAYQVIQRGTGGKADISISGTYSGSPTAIEASWNGGAYSTISASPSGGTFSGILSNQNAGQGTLSVRFTSDTSVTATKAYVGVGDIFVIAGQSNASGRGFSNQTYTTPGGTTLKASLLGNDDTWKELVDPTDSNTGQVDSVSSDSGAAGSVWPLIASLYLADQRVPVAFIPTAKGGTSITEWQHSTNASTLYGSMYRRIQAVGSVKAVLFFQGETDALNGMSRSTYLSDLENFSNAVYSDFGVKTVVGQIGNQSIADSNLDAIRLAQEDSWNVGTTTLPGPAAPDVNLADEGGDNLHFKSNGDLQIWANRWWAAIQKDFFGGSDGRGPQFVSAQENSDRTAVTVTFSDDTLPLVLGAGATGFVVKNNGVSVGTVSTTTVGTNAIRIGLQNALTGTATISFGSGSSVSGLTVPTDSSTYNLPTEIFIDQSVSVATPPPTVTTNSSSSGGGGSPPPAPTAPVGGFSATASMGDTPGKVLLQFNFGSDISTIAIATSPDFVPATYVNATTSLIWATSAKTLYIKYCNKYGVCSNPILVQSVPDTVPPPRHYMFLRNLTLRMTGVDVLELQKYLNAHGFMLSVSGVGSLGNETNYFGLFTYTQLIKFQQAHGPDILSPNGLAKGTGYFGPGTRAFVNSH